MVSYDDFQKLDIRIGEVISAERVPDADKLLKLKVDIGEDELKQIISGIALYAEPDALVGKKFPFLVNIEPRVIRGLESEGMILAVSSSDGAFSLITPSSTVPAGSVIK